MNAAAKKTRAWKVLLIVAIVVVGGLLTLTTMLGRDASRPRLANETTLHYLQAITLTGATGRIDHMDIDINRGKIFVAVIGSNSVEVVDLNTGKQIHSIRGLRNPHGILFVDELNRVFVTNGDGAVDVFDGSSFKLVKTVKLPSDADNIRYDANAKLAYVAYAQGIGIIDVVKGETVGDVKLAGRPESFQLEMSGRRIFANVPAEKSIVVIDRESRTVLAKWPVLDTNFNFPMGIDEANHRLFVGTRQPDKVMVFDSHSGKRIATLDIPRDPDDIFYDAKRKLIYVSCGEGYVIVIKQQDPDHYDVIDKIPSAQGARTALFVPELNRLYVGVPSVGDKAAELRVYEVR